MQFRNSIVPQNQKPIDKWGESKEEIFLMKSFCNY